MRKGQKRGDRLNSGYYSVIEIKGLNQDRLINRLAKEVALSDIKKSGNKRLTVKVKNSDKEKVFAICDTLCYNDVKEIKRTGIFYPAVLLVKNIGLTVGAVMFTVLAFLSDNVLLKVDYRGDGATLYREINAVLSEEGVKPFSAFNFDLHVLSDKIVSKVSKVSFASCVKKGNRLIISVIEKKEDVKTLDGNVRALYSTADGVISDIKVYSGTAVKKVGDSVTAGELLVDGRAEIKDNVVSVNVVAVVTVQSTVKHVFSIKEDGREDLAEIMAKEKQGGNAVVINTEKTAEADGFLYTVYLKVATVVFAG